MDQVITPAIWCDGTADEAAQFYADVFRDASIAERAPGIAATVSIHGFKLSLINGDSQHTPNPSISCILNFDPLLFGGEEQARTYLDGSAPAAYLWSWVSTPSPRATLGFVTVSA